MTRKEALAELIAKVESGDDAGFRLLNRAVFSTPCQDMALQTREEYARYAYKGSLDAAKALHEAVLPGWWWDVGIYADTEPMHEASLTRHSEHGEAIDAIQAQATTPARAWLLAILRALHSMEAW